jgi:hypothetical protein
MARARMAIRHDPEKHALGYGPTDVQRLSSHDKRGTRLQGDHAESKNLERNDDST